MGGRGFKMGAGHLSTYGAGGTAKEQEMQAKSRLRVETKDGRIFEATAKAGTDGAITIHGKRVKLDREKVASVILESRGDKGRITATACTVAADGTVRVAGARAANAVATLADVSVATAQSKVNGNGKPGPYTARTVATLTRNTDGKGWELRLAKSHQLSADQLTQLRTAGWRWYGGRLQAFCLATKYATREGLTLAQSIVSGFNGGVLQTAQREEGFSRAVAQGTQQGTAVGSLIS